jgi:Sulfotransferase family
MAQGMKRKFARVRRRLARRMHKLRRGRVRSAGTRVAGIDPEKIVWIFGSARTGSTWLAAMMADLKGHTGWPEPMVGYLFGHLYYERAANRHDNDLFILGGDEELWLKLLRAFVLDSTKARFPQVAEKGGYLVIKEPHGSQGAPLLMRALPESRMILLVRDPRDAVASQMDLSREGGRVRQAAKARGVEK